ncbi:hypothetical protein [Corynebacterium nuruki]|uniref:hypothetical protein n=1 Tax=Corynebacterium nuruki TaxID=1032851 RepID=UPI0039BF2719
MLDGLLHETTRSVAAAQSAQLTRSAQPAHSARPTAAAARTARPAVVAAWTGLAAAALTLLSSPWWADRLVPGSGPVAAVLLAAGLASYAVQAAVCGLLSATRQWPRYAALIAVDSAVRVVLALVAWAAGLDLVAFLLVTVVGAVTWGGVLLLPGARGDLVLRADAPTPVFLRRTGAAMAASGASALLITGFPVLFTVTAPAGTAPGALAGVITAVTVTRAPLLVPLQRFLPALIVRSGSRGPRALLRPVAALAAGTVVVAAGLWWLGQPVLRWFFPPELVAGPGTLAGLGAASGAVALLMLTGAHVLGAGHHARYLAGWVTATVVAAVLLTLGTDPAPRAVLALGAAPLTGVAVHLLPVRRRRPAPEPLPDAAPEGSAGRTRRPR